jgi:hypothetical protein
VTDDEQTKRPTSPEHNPSRRWGDQNIGKRAGDEPPKNRNWFQTTVRSRDNWYRDIWLFIITVVVLATVVTAGYSFDRAREASEDSRQASDDAKKIATDNAIFIRQINRDGADRRDESCHYFEQQEALAVKQIRRTYSYLDRVAGPDRHSLLTREIVQGLPDQYRQAQADKAPKYCDEPGIGLAEPGPELPKQRDFSFLLR